MPPESEHEKAIAPYKQELHRYPDSGFYLLRAAGHHSIANI
jgi:hypothetical protein